MRRIIVDIDNTLWDFAPVLYGRLKDANPGFPHHSRWCSWNFWKGLISAEKLYRTIRDVHMEQHTFEPYAGSGEFLRRLRQSGFYIIIASHREQETYPSTRLWLTRNNLVFDEIHLSYDKTVLFESSWAVVDDSPATLQKAEEAGIVRAGLRNPWNESEDHPLFDDLDGVFAYLKGQCSFRDHN